MSELVKALADLARNVAYLGLAVMQLAWSLALILLPVALIVLAAWAGTRLAQ